jgi:hypothetical protein
MDTQFQTDAAGGHFYDLGPNAKYNIDSTPSKKSIPPLILGKHSYKIKT